MREEYDPLNASFPAHLSIFSHFDFVSLEAETQNIVFRLLKAESEVFDVDILTPMVRTIKHLRPEIKFCTLEPIHFFPKKFMFLSPCAFDIMIK